MAERESDDFVRVDWFLRVLVSTVNGVEKGGGRLEVPVTLNVGGFLVSGYMVGGNRYFEEFASLLRIGLADTFGEEGAQSIVAPFREAGRVYDKEGMEDLPEAKHFVHLRDTRFFRPGGDPIPTTQGVLWRGRLEAVDGFTLGVFSSSSSE